MRPGASARALRLSCSIAAALAACYGSFAAANNPPGPTTEAIASARLTEDWPSYGNGYAEDHYSPLEQIKRDELSRLGLQFQVELDSGQRTDSQPLAYQGTLYIATGLSIVQAIDGSSGKVLWRHDPGVGKLPGDKLRAGWGIRGLALERGRIFVATQDGRLLALEARSGALLWSTPTLDPHDETTITGAPRVFDGKVLIGYTGGDRELGRGALNCFDAATGKFLWRFYTVPPPPGDAGASDADRIAQRTWNGEWWKNSGGGSVWNGITFDAKYRRIYIGTGNAGPWNWKIRHPGDNLYTASVVALDADTGRYAWHYQETPGDAWDYDSTADLVLTTLSLQGKPREVILHAPKNGFFYVLDRASGKLISAAKDEKVTWATHVDLETGRPVEIPAARYRDKAVVVWPGDLGVHSWHPMAFSPKTRLAYIPMIHGADVYGDEGVDPATWMPAPHRWNFGVTSQHPISAPVEEFSSSLAAWDPARQRLAWRTPTPGRAGGGVLATATGLVFQGHVDGTFTAYDALRGKPLWTFQSDSAIFGAPTSYAIDGRQFIAVLSGPPAAGMAFGGQPAWSYRGPRRLLVFALGGTQRLPAPLAPPEPLRSASDSNNDPLAIAAGSTLYNQECVVCHGPNAVSGGGAPDLRASAVPLDARAFGAVLHDGVLQSRGMPRFAEFTAPQLEQLRAYLRAAAVGAHPGASDATPKP